MERTKKSFNELERRFKSFIEEVKRFTSVNDSKKVNQIPNIQDSAVTAKDEISLSQNGGHCFNDSQISLRDELDGLTNLNSICYMNAMMQALSSSKELINQMAHIHHPTNNLNVFISILLAIHYPQNNTDSSKPLRQLMQDIKWNRTSQQDAFQLLSFAINAIQRELGTQDKVMPPKLRLLHTFSEDIKYNKVQDHLALALPLCGAFKVWPGVPLETLLNAFFEPSKIDDGPNDTTMFLFGAAPEVMLIHIQANEWDYDKGIYIKPRYHIIYDKELTYEFYIHKKIDKSELVRTKVEYQLRAVVHHEGSVSGGHYVTYKKCGNQWYLTNDSFVKEISFQCDIVPYIMVYEKIKEEIL